SEQSGVQIPQGTVSAVARDPLLRLNADKSQLQLGVYVVDPDSGVEKGNDPQGMHRPDTVLWEDILTWDLGSVDFAKARANKFSLWSAIFSMHKDKPMTAEELAKESEKDHAKRKAKQADQQRTSDSLEVRSLVADLALTND